MIVKDIFTPDKSHEAVAAFGADDRAHPAVTYLHTVAKNIYLGGPLDAVSLPAHYDFVENRSEYSSPPMNDVVDIDFSIPSRHTR